MRKVKAFLRKGKSFARSKIARYRKLILRFYKRLAALLITWVGVVLVEMYYPTFDFDSAVTAIKIVAFFL